MGIGTLLVQACLFDRGILEGGLQKNMGTHTVSPPGELPEGLFRPPEETDVTVAPGAPAGSARGRRTARAWERLRRALREAMPATVVGLVLLLIWQLLAQSGAVLSLFLPAPSAVARSFWFSLTSPTNSLVGYVATTLLESLLGCLLGAAVAIPLGYGIAQSRLVASAAQPYLAGSQALPALAIAPLLGLWLGYGLAPVIVLCALIVFFPMVITTVLGLRLLDVDIVDAARVGGANRWALLRYIEIPLALPSILAGLRTSLTLSITGAVVGEWVTGGNGRGLGELLLSEWQNLDSAGVFATLVTLAVLAAGLYGGMRLIERHFSYVEAPSKL